MSGGAVQFLLELAVALVGGGEASRLDDRGPFLDVGQDVVDLLLTGQAADGSHDGIGDFFCGDAQVRSDDLLGRLDAVFGFFYKTGRVVHNILKIVKKKPVTEGENTYQSP